MLSDINAYNTIVSLIKKNKCDETIVTINQYNGLCERIRNSTGNNLLHVACLYNRENVAKMLFNKKCSTELNDDEYTPLYYCSMNNNDQLCEFFIKNGIIPDTLTYFNACKMCDIRFIKTLFVRKSSFNMTNTVNQNLLIHALKHKRSYKIIDYISNKCDLNHIDIYHATPMHYACRCLRAGYENVLRLLAKKGGDIVIRDKTDQSPIDYIKDIGLKSEIIGLCRKYARYYRRRNFMMFLSQYNFLSGTHNSEKLYVKIFGLPDIYKQIMKYL